jgi:hypothetical protein
VDNADDEIKAINGEQGKPLSRARLRLVVAKLQVRILKDEQHVEQAKAGLEHATKLAELSDGQSRSDQTKEEMKKLGGQLMTIVEEIGIHGLYKKDLDHL